MLSRLRQNLEWLRVHARLHPSLTLLEPEGGWAAVVRIPAVESEERVVLRLLDETGVLVHPGYFFDCRHEAFVVVSLLPPPEAFREATARLFRFATA